VFLPPRKQLFSLDFLGNEYEKQEKKSKKKGLLKGIFGDIDLDSKEGKKLYTAKSKNIGAVKLVSSWVCGLVARDVFLLCEAPLLSITSVVFPQIKIQQIHVCTYY